MTTPTVHVVVVEWSGTGSDPWVYVGATWHAAARAATRAVYAEIIDEDGVGPSEWPTVAQDNPLTEDILSDPERLSDWLADFHEAVTVPWITSVEERVLGA